MKREEHKKECLEKLGADFDHVHVWLDTYAAAYWPYMKHRVFRHNKEGIEKVRVLFGDKAAEAATLHIVADEGGVPTREEIRKKYNFYP